MKTLRDAKIGETVKVVKLHGEGAVKRRIMDMGITKGVEVFVRKVAPLGDPVEVNVRGYELSLRKLFVVYAFHFMIVHCDASCFVVDTSIIRYACFYKRGTSVFGILKD